MVKTTITTTDGTYLLTGDEKEPFVKVDDQFIMREDDSEDA